MLKNIVFDFGNVIMNWNPDQILDQYNLSENEHKILKKEIFSSKEWIEVDAGIIDEDKATEIFVKRVPNELQAKVKELMRTWPGKVAFYDEVFDLMTELKKKGYHVYGLSNTGMRFANYVKKSKWNRNFDGYVLSAKEKMMKPNDRIYQKLLSRYNLKADECLFVDDLKENIEAAKKNGMQGFVFTIDRLPKLKKYIDEH